MDDKAPPGALRPPRVGVLDSARGLALVAMAIYHFTWDLEFFGYIAPGTTAFGGWKLFARCIASSFLFLAGVSLVLAHADGIRWAGFGRRFAMVAGAALAISVVTWFAVPGAFIFFGILHHIALASLLGLAFLRLPGWLTLVLAGAVIAAPHMLRSAAFDHPGLWWLGLSEITLRSNDYVPVFPWFGAVLAGMAAAQLAMRFGLVRRLAAVATPAAARPLAFAGRHSLAVYLIHQPVLIATIWLATQVAPPPPPDPEAGFFRACQASCGEVRDIPFCARYCMCMVETLSAEQSLEAVMAGNPTPALRTRVEELAEVCTAEVDGDGLEEGETP